MAQDKKLAALRGVTVALHIPTEDKLNLQIDNLTPERFRKAAAELEDYFIEVDDKYKKHRVQGRSWKAHGRKRRDADRRVRSLDFSPFPSRFANIIRMVRRDLYNELHDRCLVLSKGSSGAFHEKMYVLPFSNIPSFQKELKKQNKKIKELNDKIEKFTQTKYWTRIGEILSSYNVNLEKTLFIVPHVEDVTMDVTPLALEAAAVKEMVEEDYKRMYTKLGEMERQKYARLEREEQEGLDAINSELKQKYREIVVQGIEDVQSKLQKIIQRIAVAKKLRPKNIKDDLQSLKELSISVGLESVVDSIISPVTMAFDSPDKALDLFGTKNFNEIGEKISGRVRSLIDNL